MQTSKTMGVGGRAPGPDLKLFLGGGRGRAPRPWPVAGDGDPRVIGRCDGYPLEVRVWPRRPAAADAVWHPSGVWVAVRVL